MERREGRKERRRMKERNDKWSENKVQKYPTFSPDVFLFQTYPDLVNTKIQLHTLSNCVGACF